MERNANRPWAPLPLAACARVLSVLALVLTVDACRGKKCKKDAVQSATLHRQVRGQRVELVDPSDDGTIKKIRNGKIAEAADLAGLATQRGTATDDYGAACPDNGAGCTNLYAARLRRAPGAPDYVVPGDGGLPERGQALGDESGRAGGGAGCARSRRDNGTTDCNTFSGTTVSTGSRSSCVSDGRCVRHGWGTSMSGWRNGSPNRPRSRLGQFQQRFHVRGRPHRGGRPRRLVPRRDARAWPRFGRRPAYGER